MYALKHAARDTLMDKFRSSLYTSKRHKESHETGPNSTGWSEVNTLRHRQCLCLCHQMESQCEVIPKGYTENVVTAIDPSGFKGLKTWERGDCGGQSSELRPPDK